MRNKIIMTIVCLWTVVNYMAAEDKVYGTPISIYVGETADMDVFLDNDATYVAFQFDLYLPDGVTVTEIEVNRSRIPASTDVTMAQQEDGSYRFFATALSLEPIEGSSGKIFTLTLKAENNASVGEQTANVEKLKLSKADATGPKYLAAANFATLNVILLGDVNGDKVVDTQDAIKVIQYYLGENPSNFNVEVADITKDGNIDTQDAIQIIKKYLKK